MNGNRASPLLVSSFCALSLAFIAGMAAERSVTFPSAAAWMLGLDSLLFLLLIHGFLDRSPFRHLSLPLALFFALGLTAGRLAAPEMPSPASLSPFFSRPQTLYLAQIMAPPDFYPDKTRLSLRLHKAFLDTETVTLDGGALLSIGECKGQWLDGDFLLVRLTLARFHNFSNPGGYDYERAQAQRGLYARAYAHDDRLLIKVSQEQGLSLLRGTDRFRQRALAWLKANLEPDAAAFYASLLIGYQHLLSNSWQEHLNRVGISHLLSISGLHLGLVSLTAFWLTRRMVRMALPSLLGSTSDQHIAVCVAFAAAALYSLVSGLALPTWRSAFMLLFSAVAFYWLRSPDPISALSAAALAMLLINPGGLWEVSFQFSFAAMLGLFVLYPKLRRFQVFAKRRSSYPALKVLKPFEEAFWVSIAANALVLPLTVYYFHGISVAGLAANVALVPFTGFSVLPLGLLALAVFAFSEPLASPILAAGGWFVGVSQKMILWFSHFSWAYFWVGALHVYQLIGLYAVLAFWLGSWKWQRKVAATCTVAATVLTLSMAGMGMQSGTDDRDLHVTIVDVGQGSSTLIRFPSGETMLVDGGGFYDSSFDIGRNVLAPFLWHHGIRRLDYVVLSHDHPDHRNGLLFILDHFDVKELWESGITENGESPSRLARIAWRRHIPVRQLPQILGEHSIGNCRVHVLHPSLQYVEKSWNGEDLNEVSMVLRIDFGATYLIVPGDIGHSIEHVVFADVEMPGSVFLVVPHHGSSHSSSPLLVDRLHPQAAAISVGYGNPIGLPAPATLERYRKQAIPLYRTDLHGAVQAASNGKVWKVQKTRDQ